MRTTDPDHKETVAKVWKKLMNNGFISQGEHVGYYSVNEESFVVKGDLVWDEEEGVYRTGMGEKVEEIKEANYLFKF